METAPLPYQPLCRLRHHGERGRRYSCHRFVRWLVVTRRPRLSQDGERVAEALLEAELELHAELMRSEHELLNLQTVHSSGIGARTSASTTVMSNRSDLDRAHQPGDLRGSYLGRRAHGIRSRSLLHIQINLQSKGRSAATIAFAEPGTYSQSSNYAHPSEEGSPSTLTLPWLHHRARRNAHRQSPQSSTLRSRAVYCRCHFKAWQQTCPPPPQSSPPPLHALVLVVRQRVAAARRVASPPPLQMPLWSLPSPT